MLKTFSTQDDEWSIIWKEENDIYRFQIVEEGEPGGIFARVDKDGMMAIDIGNETHVLHATELRWLTRFLNMIPVVSAVPCEELNYFEKHLEEWLPDHEDEFILIRGKTLYGFFPTRAAAIDEGYKILGNVDFLTRLVSRTQPVAFISTMIGPGW